MKSLAEFLQEHRSSLLSISRAVPLDAVGALTAQAEQTILFERIEGYDMPLVDLLFVDRAAQARVLGCAADEVVPALCQVLDRGPRPLKVVDDAPCKARKFIGEDANLAMLPIVTHSSQDPYPYTGSFAVHKDPATANYNAMFPRCGVLGAREMVTSLITPTAHQIHGRHLAEGTRMPQAVVIGAHPAWELAATYNYRHEGWWELELYEAITTEPGAVVRCETVDLLVPADASIVIEGFVNPARAAQDGPSPGPTMVFAPYATQHPIFEVTAITMREDPVYRNHLTTPFTDHQEMPRLWQEAVLYRRLRAMNIPIRDLTYPAGGGALCLVLQLEPAQDGQVADALLTAMSAFINTKMVVAVDPDIDIYDYRDVMYALATRVDPVRDVTIVDNTRGWSFDPSSRVVADASPSAAVRRTPALASRWGIDATKPLPYRSAQRRDFERAWPPGWGQVRLEDFQ